MGHNEIIVIALFAAPILLLMLLRVNAALAFLTLCLGFVVVQLLGPDLYSFADLFMGHTAVSANFMKLGLLLAPPLLTVLFKIHTVRGTKFVMNILPAIAVGGLAVLLIVPLLSPGLSQAISDSSLWHQILRLQDLIVGGGALVSLFFVWLQRGHHGKEKKGEKHH